MRMTFLMSGCALLALTACGGGGASLGGGGSFGALQSEYDSLQSQFASSSGTPSLPTANANVAYDGVVVVADDFGSAGDGFVGDVSLTANFGANTLSGSADNFYYINRSSAGPRPSSQLGAATGTLAFNSGTTSGGSGGGASLFVDGDLTFNGNTLSVGGSTAAADIGGAFRGPNADIYEATAFNVNASGSFTGDNSVDVRVIANR